MHRGFPPAGWGPSWGCLRFVVPAHHAPVKCMQWSMESRVSLPGHQPLPCLILAVKLHSVSRRLGAPFALCATGTATIPTPQDRGQVWPARSSPAETTGLLWRTRAPSEPALKVTFVEYNKARGCFFLLFFSFLPICSPVLDKMWLTASGFPKIPLEYFNSKTILEI